MRVGWRRSASWRTARRSERIGGRQGVRFLAGNSTGRRSASWSFTEVSGPRALAVSLTFNRYRRLDYLAHQMEFLAVRGLDENDVFRMADADADADLADAQAGELSKKEVDLHPSRTVRRRGTNQLARHDWRQRLSSGVDGDWFLVVRSLNKWLSRDHGLQPYSLTVSYEVRPRGCAR